MAGAITSLPSLERAQVALDQGSGSGSSSVARRRVEIAPPSCNARIGRVTPRLLVEAFSYLSLRELCRGVVHACKYTRHLSADALLLIFKNSAYGVDNHQNSTHNFWRFPEVFIALRNEQLPALPEISTFEEIMGLPDEQRRVAFDELEIAKQARTAHLITQYWAGKKKLCLDSFQPMNGRDQGLDLKAMQTRGASLESLIFRDSVVRSTDRLLTKCEFTHLVLASSGLKQCELIESFPTVPFFEALASCKSLENFRFFEPICSTALLTLEQNNSYNPEFFSRHEVALLKLLTSVSFESFHHNGWQLTIPTLKAIATHQKQIKALSLGHSGISQVPGRERYGIFAGINYADLEKELIATLLLTSQLESLSLRQDWTSCANPVHPDVRKYYVTDQTLKTLALSCGNLRKLHLFNCSTVTTAGIASLATGCPHLEALSLIQEWHDTEYDLPIPTWEHGIYEAVDDGALEALSLHALQLKDLTISSSSITDKGVAYLKTCRQLETLDLRNSERVTAQSMRDFLPFIPPKLRFIDLRGTSVFETLPGASLKDYLRKRLPHLPATFKLLMDKGIYYVTREKEENRLVFFPKA